MMGNNMPDDYLAVVNNPDKVTTPVFFGFPWCHPVGEGVSDLTWGRGLGSMAVGGDV